jgi:hypothetical protein
MSELYILAYRIVPATPLDTQLIITDCSFRGAVGMILQGALVKSLDPIVSTKGLAKRDHPSH